MSGSGATTPTAVEAPPLDDRDLEPRTPMKRLGSTRKLAAFNNIRVQLSEQTRLLEARAEAAAGAAGELHDYCRRRAELEHDYARALDKLARAAAARHRDPRAPPPPAARAVWAAALDHTRALARDHAALADLYGAALAPRLQRAADDVLRLHRRCRDVLHERHEEVAAALAEAAAGGKAHAAAAADWRAAALKLRTAHAAREALAADPPRHKKLKALDKELDKRRARHSEARARALRARADYQLSLEAANATLQRYYLDDVADIMMCTEVGYEAVVGRSARAAGGAEAAAGAAAAGAAQALLSAADALDALADRQRFVAAHPHAFSPPRPLPFAGDPPPDHDRAMSELLAGAAPDSDDAAAAAADDLAARLRQLEAAARALRAECAENAKTLDAAEAELLRLVEGPAAQWEVAGLFGPRAAPAAPAAPTPAPADDDARRDQEDYYLQKFRAYVSSAGRLARVEARAAAARGGGGAGAVSGRARSPPRRAARARSHFAAPLGAELPAVLVSCVRVIAAYGVRQQGVFRVSGSASETAALRAAYCRGEDPLAASRGPPDVNAVCGLLKQYVRELRPPLLPPRLQEPLCRCAALPQPQFARCVRELLGGLPTGALLALRYLFAFLAHLAEHAAATMMDAWNLAICLGPTLMAAWGEGGAQVHAQNLVNELVKRTIEHHLEIFPQDVAPHTLFVPPPPPPPHEESDEADGADGAEPADEAVAEGGAGGGAVAGNGWDATADLQRYVDDDDADLAALTDTDDDPDDRASGEDEQEPSAAPPAAAVAVAVAAPAAATDADHDDDAAADTCRRLAESTPDLLLDTPARAADHFAQDRDTLRRAPLPAAPAAPAPAQHHRQTSSDGGAARPTEPSAGAGAGGALGSPVPARNTLRVAAKFADLTLTGGSLKPALAAKPALLRRPTPHPAHAAPLPAPAPAPAPAEPQ